MHIVIVNCTTHKRINVPANKVVPLSVQESCELSSASLLEGKISFFNDLQNNGYEKHKSALKNF